MGVTWQALTFPPASRLERFLLFLNLVPLGMSAAIRAFFWYFGIPLLFMDGWAVQRKQVAWSNKDESSLKSGKDKPSIDALLIEVMKKGAHSFPHSHGRPFPRHLAGLAKLINYWKQVRRREPAFGVT
jgi:hypothetical protein